MPSSALILSNVLGAIGAVVGGTVGYFLFGWIATQGYYGLMIPGGLLGFGCGLLARHKSEARGVLCGAAALVLGLFSEYRNFPFTRDDSLDYFVRHMGDLRPLTWVMLVVGALIAYYLGRTPGRFQSVVD